MIPLRFSFSDGLQVKSAPPGTRMAIYAREKKWQEWKASGFQQEAHESCCAWQPQQLIRDQKSYKMDITGQHRLVFRGNTEGIVQLELRKRFYEPLQCDPVICDVVQVNACRVDVFDRSSIIEYRVYEGAENDFDMIKVWISCENKNWAIALFSLSLPVIVLILFSLLFWCRRREERRRNSLRRSLASPLYAYPGAQGSNSVLGDSNIGGGVKQGVDFV